jgi:5-methylcytosine-specific restriction endonuclease McrA
MSASRVRLKTLKPRIGALKGGRPALLAARTSDDGRDRKRFYDSARWKRVREQKLRIDPLCQGCIAKGRTIAAEHVDHWKPLAEGGHPTDAANLVSLCHSCHSSKTMAERQGTAFPRIRASHQREPVIA